MNIQINKNLPRRIIATVLVAMSFFAIIALALTVPVGLQKNLNIVVASNEDMQPTIAKGSLVISQAVPSRQVNEGDVLSLNSASQSKLATIGRVITATYEGNYTFYSIKGDNNALPDAWTYRVDSSSYKMLFAIPVLGYIVAPFTNPVGATIFVFLLMGLSIFYIFKYHTLPETVVVEEDENLPQKEEGGIYDIKDIFFNEVGEEVAFTEKKPTRKERKLQQQLDDETQKKNENSILEKTLEDVLDKKAEENQVSKEEETVEEKDVSKETIETTISPIIEDSEKTKKTPSSEPNKAETPVKRGPGRPRKTPVEAGTAKTPTRTPAKRKPVKTATAKTTEKSIPEQNPVSDSTSPQKTTRKRKTNTSENIVKNTKTETPKVEGADNE